MSGEIYLFIYVQGGYFNLLQLNNQIPNLYYTSHSAKDTTKGTLIKVCVYTQQ